MSRKKVSPLKGKPSTLDAKQLSARAYKAAKTRAKKEQKGGQKLSPFWEPESFRTLCIPCVSAQNGPPKGPPK